MTHGLQSAAARASHPPPRLPDSLSTRDRRQRNRPKSIQALYRSLSPSPDVPRPHSATHPGAKQHNNNIFPHGELAVREKGFGTAGVCTCGVVYLRDGSLDSNLRPAELFITAGFTVVPCSSKAVHSASFMDVIDHSLLTLTLLCTIRWRDHRIAPRLSLHWR